MSNAFFSLSRLRVLRRGHVAYDQKFHKGVNIIRGENGSGKSTIADFIFYVLGGEFDSWKNAASQCDQVQAEITTLGGTLTIRRNIGKAQTRPEVFFGPMSDASRHGLDGWISYPIRRQDEQESFSQIIFRSAGIPEAQSQGTANITMNQLLRLLYADQRTPSAFLFRFESFDTREIREAVGDLVCGLSVYEAYEGELGLRGLKKEFDEKSQKLSALIEALPAEEGLANIDTIISRLSELDSEAMQLSQEVEQVDDLIDEKQVNKLLTERKSAIKGLSNVKARVRETEIRLEAQELEVADLLHFIEYLEQLADKLPRAQASADIVGNIVFTYCPACLTPLHQVVEKDHCSVCGAETDPEREQSKYLSIKLDLDIQIRESRQLLKEKEGDIKRLKGETRKWGSEYEGLFSSFAARFEVSISPRESFLAARHRRLGQIERDSEYLTRLRERALEIRFLSEQKADLQRQITLLEDRLKALEQQGAKRRRSALMTISNIARQLLADDLERQEEFGNAENVAIRFGDNALSVDGEMNFADSSSVILKNTAILSIFSAATLDSNFHHPRFVLFDNIEDKGMEVPRSHNFQELIVGKSKAALMDHQIIYSTSMINPNLNIDAYTIGPYYTHKNRTLDLGY